MARLLLAISLLLVLFLVVMPAGYREVYAEANQTIYPCSSCHAGVALSGISKASVFHGINLTVGAHSGLYCANCHVPESAMMKLHGGVEIKVLGVHTHSELMDDNKVCASCHPQTYKDYVYFSHGNTSWSCAGGETGLVVGYKSVSYLYHVCEEYRGLKPIHGKACVECHDPHNPTFRPLSILPEPSERPKPPEEFAVVV